MATRSPKMRSALIAGIVHLDDVHVHIDPTGVHRGRLGAGGSEQV